MPRSLKKGPFIDLSLQKAIDKAISENSRKCVIISPVMIFNEPENRNDPPLRYAKIKVFP